VTTCSIDLLLQLKGESFWELLKGAKVIEETLKKWGVVLADKGIEIREIGLPPEYQKAAAAKRAEELRAAGRAEEIIGTVISAVATAEGREKPEVQAEFRADPEAFYRKHQCIIDNTITKLSMEERAYLRIETPGAKGGLGDILRLIAAWQRMPIGKQPPGEPGKPGEPKKPTTPSTPELFGRGRAREVINEMKGKRG
jgi:hypothetical protein